MKRRILPTPDGFVEVRDWDGLVEEVRKNPKLLDVFEESMILLESLDDLIEAGVVGLVGGSRREHHELVGIARETLEELRRGVGRDT